MNDEKVINWIEVAKRLKELRDREQISHEKLSERLTEIYGEKTYKNDGKAESRISKQSLIDYEVRDEKHSKAGKVKGMSIETLYMLADFYEVSADYILGKTDKKSPVITTKSICKEKTILQKAIDTYGTHNQMLKCVEECGELSRAVSRILIELSSGDGCTTKDSENNLYEELADVFIMLKQMVMMFDCGYEVYIQQMKKIKRLEERLKNND